MYRILVICTLLAVCASAPFNGGSGSKMTGFQQRRSSKSSVPYDNSDTVDNSGGGYSYFKKQQIDVRQNAQPNIPLLDQDAREYMQSSALKQSSPAHIMNSYDGNRYQESQRAITNPSYNKFQSPDHNRQQQAGYGQMKHPEVHGFQSNQHILLPQTHMNNFKTNAYNNNLNNHGFRMTQNTNHLAGNNIVFPLINNHDSVQRHAPKGW